MRALAAVMLIACTGSVTISDAGTAGGGMSGFAGGGEAGGAAGSGGSNGGGSAGGSAGSAAGGTASCPDAGAAPMATGTTRNYQAGSLQTVLAMSQPGDRVLVAAGNYPSQTITAAPGGDVFLEGTGATFAGLNCNRCAHLYIRGLTFTNTVTLEGASFITLDDVTIDLGAIADSGLYIHGQGGATNMSHDITVVRSRVHRGARTIFILTNFSPNANWNHHLTFVDNDFICGSRNCFQLSGARDTRIEGNVFHDPRGGGVLTAGATRIEVLRNRMRGDAGFAAVQLATPGREWDNFAGVENMISSEITVANNVISGWSTGIQLDAATGIRVVFNTVAGGTGLRTWHRSPTDQSGNVILVGNENVTVWNNIFPSTSIDAMDPMPMNIANNLVGGNPLYADTVSYELQGGSPAANRGITNAQTPGADFLRRTRDGVPDYGAMERDGGVVVCP